MRAYPDNSRQIDDREGENIWRIDGELDFSPGNSTVSSGNNIGLSLNLFLNVVQLELDALSVLEFSIFLFICDSK